MSKKKSYTLRKKGLICINIKKKVKGFSQTRKDCGLEMNLPLKLSGI